jgi:serine/threonine protein kinase
LKPENILLQKDGHIVLSDFDLSFLTSCKPQVWHYLPVKRSYFSFLTYLLSLWLPTHGSLLFIIPTTSYLLDKWLNSGLAIFPFFLLLQNFNQCFLKLLKSSIFITLISQYNSVTQQCLALGGIKENCKPWTVWYCLIQSLH